MAAQTEVFGDEAFYWLESRFWQWSYSEIPGFVPWLNAISTALLPQHPFFLRLPFLLACWSLPWLAFVLVRELCPSRQAAWQGALLVLSVPLVGLTGILAIADVWLLLFTLLAVFLWIRLLRTQQAVTAVYLGLTLMLAVNVHIRFWFVLFVAGLAAVIIYKKRLWQLKTLWQITVPLTLLGFMPIVIFNIQHDFPLLGFQLGERNPWQFQLSHLWFFLGQIVITTPWVFWLCLVSLRRPDADSGYQSRRFIQLLALLYWLLYALLGFFSDNLRTNIHWPLPSYLLLLIVATSFVQRQPTLKKWAVVTGTVAHGVFLIGFWLLLHQLPVTSNHHKQLINNAIGWQQLSSRIQKLQQPGQMVIADNFMTAAALNYVQNRQTKLIPALSHPMNQKHGRQKQLAMMGLLYRDTPEQPALLVVEHTALKLAQHIPFYRQSCEQLDGLRLMTDVSLRQGSKLFYFFQTGTGNCEFPPIIYHDVQNNQHTGWVMVDKSSDVRLSRVSADGQLTPIDIRLLPLGDNSLFDKLDSDRYGRLHYQLPTDQNLQLSVATPTYRVLTQAFYH